MMLLGLGFGVVAVLLVWTAGYCAASDGLRRALAGTTVIAAARGRAPWVKAVLHGCGIDARVESPDGLRRG